jgi:hypothetical protein
MDQAFLREPPPKAGAALAMAVSWRDYNRSIFRRTPHGKDRHVPGHSPHLHRGSGECLPRDASIGIRAT